MTDAKSLKEAIEQYEIQLSQVDTTLSVTPKGPDRDNLLSLKSDIEELISLTKENMHSLEENNAESKNQNDDIDDGTEDALEKEYALFKAELEESSNDSENQKSQINPTAVDTSNIEDELEELEGMKCMAPHGTVHYHNAMVSSVYRNNDEKIKSIHDIKVQVFFLNPTYTKMLPCKYFLDRRCKFSDEKCHYSHGEIVPFSSLREYKEPDFHNIKVGSVVLVKQKDNLWHSSTVLSLPETTRDKYTVSLEENLKIMEADLQDLLPLDDTELRIYDTSDDSIDDNSEPNSSLYLEEQKSCSMIQSNEALSWEQHTRGIGSKILMQMGYVIGTGLGKDGDGIVEPVEIPVKLPKRKSLDYYMQLRELTGNDKDLSYVEHKKHKKQRKLEQQERESQREKQKKDNNVFNFTSKTLGDESLGSWEQHTRGIGSKLMMQMGYVMGTGLGKHGEGIVEPVEAVVLPTGKSLDYCMELRELAGNDKDLFYAERKMRKKQRKLEQQREREYQREKQKEDNNVFNFINKTLGDKLKDDDSSNSQSKNKLESESNRSLNVASFQVGENISRLERESSKLKERLARHTKGSVLYNNIVMEYNEKQKQLSNLRASEENIVAEQKRRKNKAKLTIF